jgi:hypothetical protein
VLILFFSNNFALHRTVDRGLTLLQLLEGLGMFLLELPQILLKDGMVLLELGMLGLQGLELLRKLGKLGLSTVLAIKPRKPRTPSMMNACRERGGMLRILFLRIHKLLLQVICLLLRVRDLTEIAIYK